MFLLFRGHIRSLFLPPVLKPARARPVLMCEQGVLGSYVPTASGCVCVCVCVWQEWISMCVNVYFHLKSKPTVRCQPTYLRTEPHVGTSMYPSRHPQRLPGLTVLPPPSWAAQFYPLPPPRAPPQQQSSSRVTFNQSVLPEPSSPRVSSPHSDPGPQNWGSAQGSFTGKKRLSLPQYAWSHSRVCVCVCVCVCACVCRPVCTTSAWPGPTPNTVRRM